MAPDASLVQPSSDAGVMPREDGHPAQVLCRVRMPLTHGDHDEHTLGTFYRTWVATSHAWVATDALGNIVITGSFTGAIDFGAGLVSDNLSDWAMFVAKIDPQCQLLWSHVYGLEGTPGEGGARVEGGPIGIAPDGEIALGGTLFNRADFGTGVVASTPGEVNGFSLKLRADGTTRFVKLYQGDENSDVYSVAVDGSGNVLVEGWAWTDPAFDTMRPANTSGATLAKYTAAGDPIWLHFLPENTERLQLQAAADGTISLRGDGALAWGDGTPPVQPKADEYLEWLSQLTPGGTHRWSIPIARGAAGWGVFQALDPSGVTTLSYGASMDSSTQVRAIDAIDADGKLMSHATWNSTTDLQGFDLATNAHGDAVEIGIISRPEIGDDDVYIAKHDRAGNLIWTTTEATDRVDQALGVTTDTDDNAIALWYSSDKSYKTPDELALVKLAP